ncbi:UvrB/UvrC motif-containing protein [Haloimpatiens lingqiaonensis]|uniref:UvrB/UvrC motif-containing protein n=1 Tax=Haloimpatiens lingqiaonensis TaxID=1380675 RepID=UPI0010FE997F|nr:UvrB/UvrC motif-containing protein [Haloimpatiens lingqiaonensis]
MICSVCNKKEATVHITRIINGHKEELYLCEDCARNKEGLNVNLELEPEFNLSSPFTFQSILSGIMDYMNKNGNSGLEQPKEAICKHCGTTYSEFKEKGLLGCSYCYRSFGNTLNSVIRRVQGNVEHIGKIPKTAGRDILKRKTILELREKLQRAIAEEEYEKAAELRDKIREIDKEI